MSKHEKPPLVVAISSRVLFNLDESHDVFQQQGLQAYSDYQRANENHTLDPGVAFPLIKKLQNLKHPQHNTPLVEIILLSRNSSDTGLRIFNSIEQHHLNITRAAFTNGLDPYRYAASFGSHLFLSANQIDVQAALQANIAAATLLPKCKQQNAQAQLRIAFDGDAVIFSDEAERIYQQQGLEAFTKAEKAHANKPLSAGPFKGFLTALHGIQKLFPIDADCPIRTALVTARSAPAHERVIKTLRAWDIRLDEALFLGGYDKGEFLQAFGADFFFDDQTGHCDSASAHVTTAHVPHGVTNERSIDR